MNPVARTQLGFWIYLMTDCMLFASLFAVYVVLQPATAGGPGASQLFELPLVFIETMILLTSSFMCGLAMVMADQKKLRPMIGFLIATLLLGVSFLVIELHEFSGLIDSGNSWQSSAFLSGFFVLVGTHGLHIFVGLIWLAVMIVTLLRHGITDKNHNKLKLFSMFWHFLDLIWIFIFTVVYLVGVA